MNDNKRSVRVPADAVSPERLDTGFYSHEYFDTLRLIEGIGIKTVSIGSVCEPWCFGAYALCNHIEWTNADEGIPYIKAEALGTPLLNEDGLMYVTRSTHDLLKKSQLSSGDIVVATSGTIGPCAVIPSYVRSANSNQDTIKFNPSSKGFDNYFVAAWISSRYGQVFLNREAGGAVQQHIYLFNFRRLPLLKPHSTAQRYIGSKVRQAERLRQRARELEGEVAEYFRLDNWTANRAGTTKTYRTSTGVLDPRRLDAPFHDPAHIELNNVLRRNQAMELTGVARKVKRKWKRSSNEFLYAEIGGVDLSSGIVTPTRLLTMEAPSRAQLAVQSFDVLISTVRPNRKNVALVLPDHSGLPIVASTGFSVLRFESSEAAVFYHGWLRSDAATQQLMQWNAGGTYPAIEDDVPLWTLVPTYPDDDVRRLGQRWLRKFSFIDLSNCLTTAAKLLVEHLIEGTLTEEELIAADDNPDADRAILARLQRDDGSPLFPDLDALEDALNALNDDQSRHELREPAQMELTYE